jgi:hypothetical protein
MRYLVLLGLLVGCGGNGSPPQPPVPTFCSAFLEWGPPEFRMDGSPITVAELAKYTIYVNEEGGRNQSTLVLVVEVQNPNTVSWEIRNLDLTSHWFYMTVTDTKDRTSPYSNELTKDCGDV